MSRFCLQRLRHVAADDAARQTFHDRRLPHARLADQHRIVFRPARKNLHHAPDFVVAPDDRIDLPLPRHLRQIAPILLQRLIFSFRILVRHPLRSAHLLQRLHQLVARDARLLQQLRRGAFRVRQRQQIMFGAEEFILQLRHLFLGGIDRRPQLVADPLIVAAALDLRTPLQLLVQVASQIRDRHAHLLQQRPRHPIRLVEEREQEMLVRDFLLIELRRDILRRLQRFLHLLRKFIRSHTSS